MIGVKIHNSYRQVVALCDLNLIGQTFEEGKRQLAIRESFFKEREISHEDAVKLLRNYAKEDATFNIVGQKSIKAAMDAGIISQDSVATIQGVPFTLILL